MVKVLGQKSDPLEVKSGVKGQYGQKKNRRKVPRWKAYGSGNSRKPK